MTCNKPIDLKNMEQALEDTEKIIFWDEINIEIDKICLEIAKCPKKCGNKACNHLQESEEIELALAEEMAERSIIDTLPDDELF